MSFTDATPSDPKEKLLNDITVAAINQNHAPGLPLRPFAALMIKVADDTSETIADLKAHITQLNQQNARLQRWVLALAIAALISTVIQTVVAVVPSRPVGSTATSTAAPREGTPSPSNPSPQPQSRPKEAASPNSSQGATKK